MKLLLVEDEAPMRQALEEILRRENYEVISCKDGSSGMDEALSGAYDLLILDVMLPGRSGIEITENVRKQGMKIPVLLLTALGELDDKVKGLDSGADDYLTKPFQTRELLARVRALCRRNVAAADGQLTAGDLQLDTRCSVLKCTQTGQQVRLGEKELRIMEYLIAGQGMITPREQLALKIWGTENEAEYNNVEVYISFTRKKMAYIGTHMIIKAVRGLGYELKDG
ncbi:MAG: response regulator transcription factor [Butyrivibrio sp.]|jgi:DNA-binding response OmpR family regulator|nr:response regulator transcription factor [Butyrivibrio sp.]